MHSKRFGAVALALTLAVSAAVGLSSPSPATATPAVHRGLDQLLEGFDLTDVATGIARFNGLPQASHVQQLRTLGLDVQAMEHLPLAIVRGPVALLSAAVLDGLVLDVYPNDKLEYLDTASSDSMGAAAARAAGFTGEGVTVAVVDSGCDATHPDLADHVVHNVTLVGAEYINDPPDPFVPSDGALVVPVDEGPVSNTDTGSGHGTHVAGIIAADGTTGPEHLGVAPDASLVCYSIGLVLFTTAVISAYDHMLDQPDLWDIDVVNNSWGNSFRDYDPADPVNVATKAVTDRGARVVFAAGNSGTEGVEMTLNPFSQAPWLISVAAGDLEHVRGDFSSNGLAIDNSQPVALPDDGHTRFTGDRIGLYHPDVTAPGVDISSSCDTLGTVVGPCPPGENTTASGTSMASPHVAGAVAVLLEANPNLTADQARMALQVTATPMAEPFWQVGYGFVNVGAATKMVRSNNYASVLARKQAVADRAVLAANPWKVRASDLWTWDAPRVTVAGATDTRSFTVAVADRVRAVKIAVSFPSGAVVGVNVFDYTATLTDAAGTVLGTTTASLWAGTATLLFEVEGEDAPDVVFGDWTVDVVGTVAASDPDTIDSASAAGDTVTLQVATLVPR